MNMSGEQVGSLPAVYQSKINNNHKYLKLLLWTMLALLMSSPEGHADATHLLAVSKEHKAEVVAEGADAWCQPALNLGLHLQPGSPDANNQGAQLAMMNQLKALITPS